MRIYLVGMPGSGKSTMGKALARLLQYTFIDLDDRIISQEGMSIAQIFEQKGENYFREAEKQALQATFEEQNILVATGGGTPCFFDNMEQINAQGTSIFLNIPLKQIAGRLSPEKNKKIIRPLFDGKSEEQIKESLQLMWEKRFPFYKQAHLHITSPQTKPEKVMEMLLKTNY
ncbi:shikimate kinase [Rhodocytophaga rosea]|uniref:Shikimate kinase n=1 Tax=Rhodocytophaga rosea TaxID=2704465 RepID=A0A6C0GFH9_9BACT|nr:shikimate kinase [Rhodocytophaga rosea]QHT66728.1 shikimate kinase [Rhodocytophaga rosea]